MLEVAGIWSGELSKMQFSRKVKIINLYKLILTRIKTLQILTPAFNPFNFLPVTVSVSEVVLI